MLKIPNKYKCFHRCQRKQWQLFSSKCKNRRSSVVFVCLFSVRTYLQYPVMTFPVEIWHLYITHLNSSSPFPPFPLLHLFTPFSLEKSLPISYYPSFVFSLFIWIKKMRFLCTLEYYFAINSDKLESLHLEAIIVSEINQTYKFK